MRPRRAHPLDLTVGGWATLSREHSKPECPLENLTKISR
jgi:hypothetical protein